jgi:DNA-binding CsgD family transcriptional regulator
MSKRRNPSRDEQLQVMRLLADVAALKPDPAAQRQRLIDGMNALLRTRVGWFYVVDDFVPGGSPALRHQVLASDPDPEFVRSLTGLGSTVKMEAEPFADHALHDSSPLQVWSRGQVFDRPDAAERYAPTLALYDAGKVVDGAVGLYRTGPDGSRIVGMALHRMHRDRKLADREVALLRFAVAELQDLVGRGHMPLAAPAPPGLPPRLGQVLDRLLRGAAVKRVAVDLGLSVWTVREHVQRLYRHFGVNGRDELMARFVDGRPPQAVDSGR